MRPHDSLSVLLAMRLRKEQAEERSLAELAQQISHAELERERLREELAIVTASRVEDIGRVADGLYHQSRDARNRLAEQQFLEANVRDEQLRQRWAEQMVTYVASRRDREIISDLKKQRGAALEKKLRSREEKCSSDLFLMRRVWK